MSRDLLSLLDEHPFGPDDELVHTEGSSVTRSQFEAMVAERSARLIDLGLGRGHPVAVVAPNTVETLAWMFATWQAGGVYVPVNPAAPDGERRPTLDATSPAVVVDGDEVTVQDGSRLQPDGAAFVLWTSGPTGRPKAVVHTHGAYVELLDRVLGPLRARPRDPARPPTPNLIPVALALNAGLYNSLFALRAGASIVLMERFAPDAFARLVARHAIRSTVLPPAAMVALADDEGVTDLGPLRYVRSITAPLSPPQARRFTAQFPGTFVLNSYGQAEVGEVVGWTAQDAKDHPDKLGAAGRPHPGVDVRVVGGQLEVRPPNRTEAYADGASVADRVTPDGFWRTGDLAHIDDDGFVWIEGRVGDVINRGGNKVAPQAVEEVLRSHPAVVDAAVVGRPDERLGEVPVAFVEARVPVQPEALEALCREHLVPYKVPVEFVVVGALPRNAAGKVLRGELS